MSGETTRTNCKGCGKDAWAYFDWKPVAQEINECPHYECGFIYNNTNGVVETFYQSEEQIKELRIHMGLEQEVA